MVKGGNINARSPLTDDGFSIPYPPRQDVEEIYASTNTIYYNQEDTKKNLIESTYYLDNLEKTYNSILKEYQNRNNGNK
jgi:hypothetical protein